MIINIPISFGELVDKLTILEIKKEFIQDNHKVVNVKKEYEALNELLESLNIDDVTLKKLYKQLYSINLKLWNIEDKIRLLEKEKNFDDTFIQTARSVYVTNDLRFEIKNKINRLFDSSYKEEKSYEEYT